MGGDKRSVSTDALETLGTIIDKTAGRDAIHLAVEPAVAGHTLRPGEHVGFLENGTVGICGDPLGIVDPFLSGPVRVGEMFWLVVYPRQITSLRHVWTHPAFDKEAATKSLSSQQPPKPGSLDQRLASEAWLRTFISGADCPSYESVMEVIEKGEVGDGYEYSYLTAEYLHFGGSDAHGDIPPEFWDHVEIVLGKKIKDRASYFSCSC